MSFVQKYQIYEFMLSRSPSVLWCASESSPSLSPIGFSHRGRRNFFSAKLGHKENAERSGSRQEQEEGNKEHIARAPSQCTLALDSSRWFYAFSPPPSLLLFLRYPDKLFLFEGMALDGNTS